MYVSRDLFERALPVLAALTGGGERHVLVGTRSFQFYLENKDLPLPDDISHDDLDEVAEDVSDILLAATSSVSAEGFAERRSGERREYPGVAPEAADIAREKFEATIAAFDVEALRARRWAKSTSPVDIAHAIEWEIVDRRASGTEPVPGGPVRVGVLTLVSENVGHRYIPEYTKVTMTVDLGDIDFMIEKLRSMRKAWEDLAAERSDD